MKNIKLLTLTGILSLVFSTAIYARGGYGADPYYCNDYDCVHVQGSVGGGGTKTIRTNRKAHQSTSVTKVMVLDGTIFDGLFAGLTRILEVLVHILINPGLTLGGFSFGCYLSWGAWQCIIDYLNDTLYEDAPGKHPGGIKDFFTEKGFKGGCISIVLALVLPILGMMIGHEISKMVSYRIYDTIIEEAKKDEVIIK